METGVAALNSVETQEPISFSGHASAPHQGLQSPTPGGESG